MADEAAAVAAAPFPEFDVPYKRQMVPWSKFRGKAMIVCNVKVCAYTVPQRDVVLGDAM